MDAALERIAEALGIPPLTAAEQEMLLDCARDVAHGAERRDAPLSTFLVGAVVGSSQLDREIAIRNAVERVRAAISAPDTSDGGPTAAPR